jgi:hypothetical protein
MLKTMALVATFLSAGAASAQDGDWTYRATIYAWLPAMSTSVETRFGTIEQDASGSSVLDALDMAFMGSFSAQNGNWGVVGDLLYADLSQTTQTPLPLFDSASIGVKLTALSGYGLYRVSNDSPVQFDIGAGFRNFNIGVDTSLSAGLAPAQAQSVDGSWTDPLLAARLMVPIDEKWFLMGFADFGGTGANDQTYQVYTGIGYNFDPAWSMQIGYRYMDITNTLQGRDVNIGLSGGLMGVTYSF